MLRDRLQDVEGCVAGLRDGCVAGVRVCVTVMSTHVAGVRVGCVAGVRVCVTVMSTHVAGLRVGSQHNIGINYEGLSHVSHN